MKRPDYTNQIRKRIEATNAGTVFVTADFTDIAEKKTVNMALLRLAEEGILRKAMFGVYYKYGVYLMSDLPVLISPDDIAYALARNFGWTIVPCGKAALYTLGLSKEFPLEWIFVTDGAYKEYDYNGFTIKFKHTASKDISKLSYETAIVIQVLKELGRDNVTDETIDRLKNFLRPDIKARMLLEATATTAWVYEVIKKICKDD